MTDAIDAVAAATAECGMQSIANWLPAGRHEELRELLYDLVFTAIHAYREARAGWRCPDPNSN